MEEQTLKNCMTRFFTIFTGQAFSLIGSALVQFALKPCRKNTNKSIYKAAFRESNNKLCGTAVFP